MDDIRLAIQPELQGPPTSGLGTVRGEAPRDDGNNKDKRERRRAATEEAHAVNERQSTCICSYPT